MNWLDTILQGILLGGLYALFAAGLSLVFGIMRLVNLAHGDLIVLGAYLVLFVTGSTGMNPFLAAGACIVTMPRFDLEAFLTHIQTHRPRHILVAPPVAIALAKHPMVDQFDLSSLRIVLSAAAPPLGVSPASLATVSPDGQPSVRMVLLKEADQRGFCRLGCHIGSFFRARCSFFGCHRHN